MTPERSYYDGEGTPPELERFVGLTVAMAWRSPEKDLLFVAFSNRTYLKIHFAPGLPYAGYLIEGGDLKPDANFDDIYVNDTRSREIVGMRFTGKEAQILTFGDVGIQATNDEGLVWGKEATMKLWTIVVMGIVIILLNGYFAVVNWRKPHRFLFWFQVTAVVIMIPMTGFNLYVTTKLDHIKEKLSKEDLSKYTLIHMPASGKCPDGFEVAPDIFHRDGKAYAGCLRIDRADSDGMIDMLLPGEGVEFGVLIQPPPPEKKEHHI